MLLFYYLVEQTYIKTASLQQTTYYLIYSFTEATRSLTWWGHNRKFVINFEFVPRIVPPRIAVLQGQSVNAFLLPQAAALNIGDGNTP